MKLILTQLLSFVITFIFMGSFFLYLPEFSVHSVILNNDQILISHVTIDKQESKPINCSCLNNIFDEIFVVSIADRIDTLKLTLYQLDDANIKVTIWEGHSTNNPYSMHLWYKFRMAAKNTENNYKNNHGIPKPKQENNPYHSKFVFFLRQTQIDIIKYAKKYNLNKILILEDDILLANPYYINLFCEIESSLPKWYILNIG
eukprot:232271_1